MGSMPCRKPACCSAWQHWLQHAGNLMWQKGSAEQAAAVADGDC